MSDQVIPCVDENVSLTDDVPSLTVMTVAGLSPQLS